MRWVNVPASVEEGEWIYEEDRNTIDPQIRLKIMQVISERERDQHLALEASQRNAMDAQVREVVMANGAQIRGPVAMTIPIEIAQEIALFAIAIDRPQLSLRSAPMNVSQVCSHWRRAASFPRLWTKIHVDVSEQKWWVHERRKAAMQSFLLNARGLPLDVEIDIATYLDWDFTEEFIPLNRYTNPAAEFLRWIFFCCQQFSKTVKTLSFIMRYSWGYTLVPILRDQCPALSAVETLMFRGFESERDYNHWYLDLGPINLMHRWHTPNLRHLSIYDPLQDYLSGRDLARAIWKSCRWNRMTHITLPSSIRLDWSIVGSTCAPMLEHMDIAVSFHEHGIPTSSQEGCLPSLHTLRIHELVDLPALERVIQCHVFPNLRRLGLRARPLQEWRTDDTYDGGFPDQQPSLVLQEYLPKLEELTIIDGWALKFDIAQYLHLQPQLSSFSMNIKPKHIKKMFERIFSGPEPTNNESSREQIRGQAPGSFPLPNLSTLCICVDHGDVDESHELPDYLLRMLHARTHCKVKLEKVHLECAAKKAVWEKLEMVKEVFEARDVEFLLRWNNNFMRHNHSNFSFDST